MAGLSMGGFQTQATVFNNLDVFSAAGMFSAPFLTKNTELDYARYDYTELLSDVKTFNEKLNLLFVSAGEQEPMLESISTTLAELGKTGIKFVLYTMPGHHEWNVWRYSAYEFLKRVFK